MHVKCQNKPVSEAERIGGTNYCQQIKTRQKAFKREIEHTSRKKRRPLLDRSGRFVGDGITPQVQLRRLHRRAFQVRPLSGIRQRAN